MKATDDQRWRSQSLLPCCRDLEVKSQQLCLVLFLATFMACWIWISLTSQIVFHWTRKKFRTQIVWLLNSFFVGYDIICSIFNQSESFRKILKLWMILKIAIHLYNFFALITQIVFLKMAVWGLFVKLSYGSQTRKQRKRQNKRLNLTNICSFC